MSDLVAVGKGHAGAGLDHQNVRHELHIALVHHSRARRVLVQHRHGGFGDDHHAGHTLASRIQHCNLQIRSRGSAVREQHNGQQGQGRPCARTPRGERLVRHRWGSTI